VELQGRVETLRARGLGLAAISYDPPATLADFAARRGITFTMLSDRGSAIIRKYGLLNRQVPAGTSEFGIPYPGTFLLDAHGIVTARFFEPAYQERNTVSSMLVRTAGAEGTVVATEASTAHLALTALASDRVVAPGTRLSLIIEVRPKAKMHVYAPGAASYSPITLTIDPQPDLVVHPLRYPKSQMLFFAPLAETVPVYQEPFRLVQDVTLSASPEAQARLKRVRTLTITGSVHYQACDDKICYIPATVPVSWTLDVRQLDRERVKKSGEGVKW
jgi:hypothetical protein